MSIPTEGLSAVLKEQSLPANWTSAVIDPDGIIAGRSTDSARLVGRPITPSLRQAIASTKCPIQTVTYDGAQLSSCAVRVPDTDWTVAVGVPSGTYERDLRSSLLKLFLAGLASLVIGGLAAVRIANVLREQVKLLGESARDANKAGSTQALMREVAAAARSIEASHKREGALESKLIEAKHDSLTGLPRRQLFRELVEFDIDRADNSEARIALLFIDLDGFKAVNDRQGHAEGDRLLREVANAIRAVVRVDDVAARYGGDEFIVYLRATAHDIQKIAEYVARRLVDHIMTATGLGCSIGGSIGHCDFPSLARLLARADDLQLQAKRAGKGRFIVQAED